LTEFRKALEQNFIYAGNVDLDRIEMLGKHDCWVPVIDVGWGYRLGYVPGVVKFPEVS
jgi:hypothetical protein